MSQKNRPKTKQPDRAAQLREHLEQMLIRLRSYKLAEPLPVGGVVQREREKDLP